MRAFRADRVRIYISPLRGRHHSFRPRKERSKKSSPAGMPGQRPVSLPEDDRRLSAEVIEQRMRSIRQKLLVKPFHDKGCGGRAEPLYFPEKH